MSDHDAELPELTEGQVRVRCPICSGLVDMPAETELMPEHSFEKSIRYSQGRGQVDLPISVMVRCISSGGRMVWKWVG